ncbi:hypothetical protein V2I01_34430 [Micromonospora sp. BRA006-A]|nr:hypothetical protein [Micromonospora sp. BRA006-A]
MRTGRAGPPPRRERRAALADRGVAAAGMAVMGALGAARIAASAPSAGELATRRAVTSPWPGIGAALTGDEVALGPYHLLLRGWAALFGAADLSCAYRRCWP